jgi:predicted ABC-type ATPase
MTAPVLHLITGPNGSGKSSLYENVLGPATHLPFVNADQIAAARWRGAEMEHGYEAAREASHQRDGYIEQRTSFVTETVFSHPSKVELVRTAKAASYQITLHVILIPAELAVTRVALRVAAGGHDVPEERIRARYERLWGHIVEAIEIADTSRFYDNTNAQHPFRVVARYEHGRPSGTVDWPAWTSPLLRALPT